MLLSQRLLRGAPAAAPIVTHHILFIARQRYGEKEPTAKDRIGWRLDGAKGRILVFRSPQDPSQWLTEDEFRAAVSGMLQQGVVFERRRGYTPLSDPKEGDLGWLTKPKHQHYRQQVKFVQGTWVPAPSRSHRNF